LQLLFRCQRFAHTLLQTEDTGPLHRALKDTLVAVASGAATPKALRPFLPDFFDGRQHDAHEFLVSLLQLLDSESEGSSWVSTIFGGKSLTLIECTRCQRVVRKPDDFAAVTLFLGEATTNVEKLIDSISQKNPAEGYTCESCNASDLCTIHAELTSLPRSLLLTPLRFSPTASGAYKKARTSVDIPMHLELKDAVSTMPVTYRLGAVVSHLGRSLDSGHYVGLCSVSGVWYSFDDQRVSQLPETRIAAEWLQGNTNVVLLRYERA
jgi:uncharacterized UBP type Zn finger protein